MIKYYDGRVDTRPTLTTEVSGGFVYAIQMNKDGSTEAICYDDLEYGAEVREADVCVDANDFDYDLNERYLAYNRLGKEGIYAKVGDVVKIIKGRKYAKNIEFTVSKINRYSIPGTYGHKVIIYLCDINNEYRVDAFNTLIVDNERIKFCREHGEQY